MVCGKPLTGGSGRAPNVTKETDRPPRAAVLGTPISLVSARDIIDLLGAPSRERASVVCFCNVHAVMTARRSQDLSAALRSADITAPDGRPIVWAVRATADPSQDQIRGTDLMLEVLADSEANELRHYLLGGTTDTLDRLQAEIRRLAPSAQIAGVYSPPYVALEHFDNHQILGRIRESRADIVWVGLGMPKQEVWMQHVRESLPEMTLLGVGAAFDFIAGTARQAPPWMQKRGLEWAFRLAQEPTRLWRRYALNNPLFMLLLARQIMGQRWQRRSEPSG